ncbi:MAG: cytochrome c oxidase assembly protein, partial [Gammaproteobacteria bacterium]|nr:cytochrome c oxidase assembly protein [Gammaproteobacteria bacterium]
RPTEHRLKVRLGEINTTNYYARNRAAQAVTGQAVPSVTPGYAAKHLHKVECFCFTQQRLEGGEDLHMPVKFYIDDELPAEVHTLSLSYTLFKVQVPEGIPETLSSVQEASLRMTLASNQK